ncbi:unnamed protein product [Phytomonas sp. EM1]|nr:unnamed protein product [Phytomonas sp. EM1]|eukprot:CCW64472.1 unnamed protein product [Phytomonas sp. isolate EM1]
MPITQNPAAEDLHDNRTCVHGRWTSRNSCLCDPGYRTAITDENTAPSTILCDFAIPSQNVMPLPFYKNNTLVICAAFIAGLLLIVICFVICKYVRKRKNRGNESSPRNPKAEARSYVTNTLAPAPMGSPEYYGEFNAHLSNPVMNMNHCMPVANQRRLEIMLMQAQRPQSELCYTVPFPEPSWQPNGAGVENDRYVYMNTVSERNPGARPELVAVCCHDKPL